MRTWARWITGAAAAATLVGGSALAQGYNSYPGAPPPGQGTYAQPQPGYDQYDQGEQYDQDDQDDRGWDRDDSLNFRGSLSPYGEWISVPGVGEVWRPYERVVGAGFQPYASSGHWVYTDYGWAWQSDYAWGWAPFHYGRWVYRPRWGWLWRPGRQWGPAWVEWRQSAGYVGWAPMGPAGVEWIEPVSRPSWCFVDTPNFVSPRLSAVILAPERVRVVFGTTAPIRVRRSYDMGTFYAGPPIAHVASVVGHPIAPVAVSPGHFGWRARPVGVGAPPAGMGTGGRYVAPPPSNVVTAPPPAGGRYVAPPPSGGQYVAPPPSGGRYVAPPPSGGQYVAPPPSGGRYVAPPPSNAVIAPPPGRGNDRHEERREWREERREERHEERGGGRPVYVAPPPSSPVVAPPPARGNDRHEERREDHDNGRHEGDHHGRGR